MSAPDDVLVPVFSSVNFSFKDDQPVHIEAARTPPLKPSRLGGFILYGVNQWDQKYTLAVDIPNDEVVGTLAGARMRRMQEFGQFTGHTDDLWLYNVELGTVYISK